MIDDLRRWLPHQRWFAGKGRAIDDVQVVSDVRIVDGLRHLVLAVRQGETADRYQLWLGERPLIPDHLTHAAITAGLYDAAHDADLMEQVLEAMAKESTAGPLRFRRSREIETGLRSLVLTAEQSNTSVAFGDVYICKFFRRLVPGVNPELEVAMALNGSEHIAQPYGWIETVLDGEITTCAVLQEYLATASDGWQHALTSVRDYYASMADAPGDAGADFAAESNRLGVAAAELHGELASAFGTTEEISDLAGPMHDRLRRAVREVPSLADVSGVAARAFDELAAAGHAVPMQRIHGDFHLGQVLRTPRRWVVLDFEGEPGLPLSARRAFAPALRDVAGMLRSFDYAARHLALSGGGLDPALDERASAWSVRNREAFRAGYASAGGQVADPVLLRALELDKAVYEVLYEARNRPSWLPIPLAAFQTTAP